MRGSWKLVAFVALVAAGGVVLSSPAMAVSYTPVTISQLEENNTDGSSYWATLHPTIPLYHVQFVGVVVNKPSDMLNYTYSSSNTSPQFQVFVQALSSGGTYGDYTVAPGDFGGAAVYMRRLHPMGDHTQDYTDSEWATEMTRIGASTLNYGDVVLVQAKAPGMFFNGKFNINEQHKKSSDYDFSITVLGQTTPTAAPITLSALKDTSNHFIFDSTRASGCEEYQGSLVHLDNLLLTDPGDWGLGKTVTVSQGSLTFPMQVGLDSGLGSVNPDSLASHSFSATAIVDQEGGDYQGGYSLWLTSASNLSAVPEPGSLVLLAAAGLTMLILGWRRFVNR